MLHHGPGTAFLDMGMQGWRRESITFRMAACHTREKYRIFSVVMPHWQNLSSKMLLWCRIMHHVSASKAIFLCPAFVFLRLLLFYLALQPLIIFDIVIYVYSLFASSCGNCTIGC